MYYLDTFYFMIVTTVKLGYGDIYPESIVSRLVVLAILLTIFAVFGENVSKLA